MAGDVTAQCVPALRGRSRDLCRAVQRLKRAGEMGGDLPRECTRDVLTTVPGRTSSQKGWGTDGELPREFTRYVLTIKIQLTIWK